MMLSPLVQAGALQNSQSPVDTDWDGDGTSMEPFAVPGLVNFAHFRKVNVWCGQVRGPTQEVLYRNNAAWKSLANGRLPMPRYFFDVKNGHRLFDASGFVCEDDTDAIIRATVLAIGVSLDKPEDEPERRIAIINDAGREIGTVPVYSKPSYGNPAK